MCVYKNMYMHIRRPWFFFAKGWLYLGLARPLRISYKFVFSVALGFLPLERNKERKKQTNKEQKKDIDQERNKDRTKEGNEEKKETKTERKKEMKKRKKQRKNETMRIWLERQKERTKD